MMHNSLIDNQIFSSECYKEDMDKKQHILLTGNEYDLQSAASWQDCSTRCAEDTQCKAWNWFPGYYSDAHKAGKCQLLDSDPKPETHLNVHSAIKTMATIACGKTKTFCLHLKKSSY